MKLTNFIKRFIALAIDFLIVAIIEFSLLMVIVVVIKITNLPPLKDSVKRPLWFDIIIHLYPITGSTLMMIYFTAFETIYNATLGKMALKLRTKMKSGERISASRAIIRFLLIPITSFAGIGFIFYIFSNKNQFLHDWLTETYVE